MSTPVSNNGTRGKFPEDEVLFPLGLPVLNNSEQRKQRNQNVDYENGSDSTATKVSLEKILSNLCSTFSIHDTQLLILNPPDRDKILLHYNINCKFLHISY